MDGIINIYKEKGYTSHDVVAKLRGILKQKKIGHTGTLDPDAEGVLPVCLGKATKLCDLLTEKDKCYEVVLKLGVTTDTQDLTGLVLTTQDVMFQEDLVKEAILSFQGDYEQIPPMYSALKVNGKKLYELAREGIEIERNARLVKIYRIEILGMNASENEVHMRVECSKGTYIRTLCFDIGEKLGCGGTMKTLLRTRVERFLLTESILLSEVEQRVADGTLQTAVMAIEDMFGQYGVFNVKEEKERFLNNGNQLSIEDGEMQEKNQEASIFKMYDTKHTFKGLYQMTENRKCLKPYKMFL
ncbi:MAG: tRNA pseudouridine(55) synthase TruB [Velocimicrobium sp.]